jgi:L-lactate dehydrogenase complex protein LldG
MTDREKIFARVKEALQSQAPRPGEHGHHATAAHTPVSPRKYLPYCGESFDEKIAMFKSNATNLKATFMLVSSSEEAQACLVQLGRVEQWKKIATHSGALTTPAARLLGLPVLLTDEGYESTALEVCDVGITECDALVAQTGSVLVTSRSAGGRALSVLPPHHVVLARRDQLVPDLPEAFTFLQRKYSAGYPSFVSFITGPSRTGDIERILVLGAHGPKKLTIICH